MAMPTVMCCGCSLRTGSMVIAIWTIISSTVVVAIGSWGVEIVKDDEETRFLLVAALTFGCLNLLFGGILLVGVVKKVPGLLMSWVIFQSVFVVFSIIGLFYLLTSSAPWSSKFEEIASTALSIYCVLVVHSYRKQLVDQYASMNPVSLRVTPAVVEVAPLESKPSQMQSTTYTSTSVV